MVMDKIIAILNPISGCCECERLNLHLEEEFKDEDISVWQTTPTCGAKELAQNAVKKNPDIIIACGGDGTISQIIPYIINTPIKLGIIPVGTGNLLAFNLGIPPDTKKAISIIKDRIYEKTDIGMINNIYFSSIAGCGFDAYIVNKTSPEKKREIGIIAYFIEGVKQALKTPHIKFKMVIDGKKIIKAKAVTILIANKAHIFGEYLSVIPKVLQNDSKLDIVVVSPISFWGYFKIVWCFFTKQHCEKSRRLQYFQAKTIDIISHPKIFVQADGEIIGQTPVKAHIIKEGINVIIPKKKHRISRELIESSFRKLIGKAVKSIKGSFFRLL